MSEYRHIANLKGPGADMVDPVVLSGSDSLNSLPPGMYRTNFESTSEALGLPGGRNGVLERLVPTTSMRLDRFTSLSLSGEDAEVWIRGADTSGAWSDWEQVHPAPSPQDNPALSSGQSVFDLNPGEYRVNFGSNAVGNGLPVARSGYVRVIRATSSWRTITFTPTYGDTGTGATQPYEMWVCGMDNDNNYYPAWDRVIAGGTHVRAAQAVVTDGNRDTVFARNPDRTDRPASTLKILTAHVARTVVTDSMLDDTVEFTDADTASGSSANLQVGDVVTWRDLFYGLMLPSGNDAAQCIARIAGGLLSGSGDPYQRFINEMNTVAQSYGWDGANFANPSGLGSANQMSVSHLVDLLYRIADDDPWLVEVMGTYRREITIHGDNARTYHVTHSFDPLGEVTFPEAIAAKTGTLGGHTCLAMLFEGPNGETCAAALIGSTSSERYPDMRRLVDAARRATDPDAATGGMVVPETILNERIDGITGGTVRISRSAGGTVSLTIQAAGLPDGFAQAQCIPAGLRPSNSFIYETVTVGNQSNPVSRGAQVNADSGQLRIYGEIDGSVRGSMTWATA